MHRYLFALVLGLALVCCASVTPAADTWTCWGIVAYRHGKRAVIIAGEGTGPDEKAAARALLFKDEVIGSIPWQVEQWRKTHAKTAKLAKAEFDGGALDGQHLDFTCSKDGKKPSKTTKWPAANWWPNKDKYSMPPHLTWAPGKVDHRAYNKDEALEFVGRSWRSVPNPSGVPRWQCKKELLFKRFVQTSSGRELGSEVHRVVVAQVWIRGPQLSADANCEAALKTLAGKDIHIVTFGGATWQDGTREPPRDQVTWSDREPW